MSGEEKYSSFLEPGLDTGMRIRRKLGNSFFGSSTGSQQGSISSSSRVKWGKFPCMKTDRKFFLYSAYQKKKYY